MDIRGTHKTAGLLTDSATYTFHVGPAAELEVRDAGASPEVARSQQAYTIMAVNNGPQVAPAVKVSVTGVPADAEAIPSQGRYVETACQNGLCAGDWIIGKLGLSDVRRAAGLTGDPTLTLVTAAGAPITATIENTEDYCVRIETGAPREFRDRECVGSLPAGYTEHSTAYYDYVDRNNTAKVAARAGTASGAGDPGQPRSLRVQRYGAIAILWWAWMERVNGFRVTHYHVERNGITVATDVLENMYVDLQGDLNQAYRVRAVNEFGVAGPWSGPAGASGPLTGLDPPGPPSGLTATAGVGIVDGFGRIDLSWFAPAAESSLRYRIEHSADGTNLWQVLASGRSGTTYSHQNLLPGTTHYYRVAAVKGSLTSAWSYVQGTTEAPPEVNEQGVTVHTSHQVPLRPENLRFSSLDRTSVTLVWDPPVNDGGSPVTAYEYRVFGPCASGADAICDIVAPTRVSGTSRRITGLNRETMIHGTERQNPYQFQVRALNAVGASDWSDWVEKVVGTATARGGRVVLSPSRLTVREGGEATYRVKLSREPDLPLAVGLHWMGDEGLGDELRFQQFRVLLPSGYDTSGVSSAASYQDCEFPGWEETAYAWNVGVPITVEPAEDDDSENGKFTILHDIFTLPPDCLGDPSDYAPDPGVPRHARHRPGRHGAGR